jgi:hypothetical protein
MHTRLALIREIQITIVGKSQVVQAEKRSRGPHFEIRLDRARYRIELKQSPAMIGDEDLAITTNLQAVRESVVFDKQLR